MHSRLARALVSLGFLIVFASTRSLGQSSASVTASSGSIRAGESVTVQVHFDAPPSYDTTVYLNFLLDPSQNDNFVAVGPVRAGQDTVTAIGTPSLDTTPGRYSLKYAWIGPAQGNRKNPTITVPQIAVDVRGVPDQNKYPKQATVELRLTQQQLLRTGAAQLQTTLDTLVTKINDNSADTPLLRSQLSEAVTSALRQLDVVEAKFKKEFPNEQAVFFDDFRRHYQTLLIQLKAPQQASGTFSSKPIFTFVQLQRRPGDDGHRFVGSYTALASAVVNLMQDNIAAYLRILQTGVATFQISLGSIPTGASVSYKKVGDDQFQDYSSPTDVPHAKFPFAYWIFKFEKQDCATVMRQINPYIESSPDLTVELHCKHQ